MPTFRIGIGDETGRVIQDQHGHLEWRWAPDNAVEIVNLVVDNEHRRTGVGRRLVSELPNARTYVFTAESNRIAHEFYEALGFRLLAKLPEFYSSGGARLYFRETACASVPSSTPPIRGSECSQNPSSTLES